MASSVTQTPCETTTLGHRPEKGGVLESQIPTESNQEAKANDDFREGTVGDVDERVHLVSGFHPRRVHVISDDLCRLCGSEDSFKLGIFSEDGKERELAPKIFSLLHFQVTESDPLPKVLCFKCVLNLENFSEFRLDSLDTLRRFEEALRKADLHAAGNWPTSRVSESSESDSEAESAPDLHLPEAEEDILLENRKENFTQANCKKEAGLETEALETTSTTAHPMTPYTGYRQAGSSMKRGRKIKGQLSFQRFRNRSSYPRLQVGLTTSSDTQETRREVRILSPSYKTQCNRREPPERIGFSPTRQHHRYEIVPYQQSLSPIVTTSTSRFPVLQSPPNSLKRRRIMLREHDDRRSHARNDSQDLICLFCQSTTHLRLTHCINFRRCSIRERFKFVKSVGLCTRCFRDHHVSKCLSRFSCEECGEAHNSLLHYSKKVVPFRRNP